MVLKGKHDLDPWRASAEHPKIATMPSISHLLEMAIYVDDLDVAQAFYGDLLGLELVGEQKPRHVFFRIGDTMLLIFNAAETLNSEQIPAHGTTGAGHIAFGVPDEEYEVWKSYLVEHEILIEQEVEWPRGGRSIYFRDPSGNSLELMTKGCWGTPAGW